MNRRVQTRSFNKPKNRKYITKRLFDYLFKFKWWLVVAFILTILTNLFSLIGPALSGSAIDEIKVGKGLIDFGNIYFYAILLLVFYILSSLFSFILNIMMIKISKKIVYELRKDCFEKIIVIPVGFFDSNQTGDIISRMSYDIDTINTSLSSDIIHIATAAITIIGSLTMMLIISPLLVLILVVTIPISLLFTRFMLKRTHKLFKRRSQTLGSLNGYVEEMITGSKTIKAYGNEEITMVNFDKANNENYDIILWYN